jgi:hypothetical protein
MTPDEAYITVGNELMQHLMSNGQEQSAANKIATDILRHARTIFENNQED